MYSQGVAKKFVNGANALILESNKGLIERYNDLLVEKLELDKEKLEEVSKWLVDEISKETLYDVLQKKKKSSTKTREPTKYNLFVKDKMALLKQENPELKNVELMAKVAELWNEEKNKSSETESKDESNDDSKDEKKKTKKTKKSKKKN